MFPGFAIISGPQKYLTRVLNQFIPSLQILEIAATVCGSTVHPSIFPMKRCLVGTGKKVRCLVKKSLFL